MIRMASGKTKLTKRLKALGLGFALLIWLDGDYYFIGSTNTTTFAAILAESGGGITLPPGG
ncbi:MAG: hypothetical protein WCS37_01335 [Chloroflexota bacterium]